MADRSWTSAELAHAVCDRLVQKGQLKEKPAFIRTDRESKIAGIFADIGLNGARMSTFDNPGPLEMLVRRGTSGETWVQSVTDNLIEMLPESAATAQKKMVMDDDAKAELEAAKEKSAQRRDRLDDGGGGKGDGKEGGNRGRDGGREGGYAGRGDGGRGDREERGFGGRDDRDFGGRGDREERGGGWGDGGRGDRDDRGFGGRGGDRDDRGFGGRGDRNFGGRGDREERGFGGGDREERGGWGDSGGGKGRGKGSNMECYNCQQLGHTARDCPEPSKGKGRGKRRGEMQCNNCKAFGHKSRDCPEPVDEDAVRERLAARAEKERRARESDDE